MDPQFLQQLLQQYLGSQGGGQLGGLLGSPRGLDNSRSRPTVGTGGPVSGGYSPIAGTGHSGPGGISGVIRPGQGGLGSAPGYSPTVGSGRQGPFGQGGPRLPWQPQQPPQQALWGQSQQGYGAVSQPTGSEPRDLSWNPQPALPAPPSYGIDPGIMKGVAGAVAGQMQPAVPQQPAGLTPDQQTQYERMSAPAKQWAPATFPGQQPQPKPAEPWQSQLNQQQVEPKQPEQPVQDNALTASPSSRAMFGRRRGF